MDKLILEEGTIHAGNVVVDGTFSTRKSATLGEVEECLLQPENYSVYGNLHLKLTWG